MKKIIIIFAISIIVTGIIIIPTISDQFVDANSRRKVHFTQTITSSQDPGVGHENHQLALILSPNEGTIYDGSMTYTATEPVQIVIFHEIAPDDTKGQPTWTVDSKTFYAMSVIEPETNSGSIEFTGAAIALHTEKSEPFTATVSVDGWIRGQPTEVIMQKVEIPREEPTLKLARTSLPVTIPLHLGTFNEESVYYIITDASNQTHADLISEKQNWKVEIAPPLINTPESTLETVYVFKDGIVGDGIYGYQSEVFSNTPAQTDQYSPLRTLTNVSWKIGQNPEILDSVDAIINASDAGRIKLEEENVVINMPQIIWPDGQMPIRENKTLTQENSYTEGQILDINTDNMTVSFVAHRGWAHNGETIYYIITDATPLGPAELMGVTYAPTSSNLITYPVAVDLFHFMNGIKGSGPLGFQPGISAAAPGDENYSPMWRIFTVSWNDPQNASVLETKRDIDAMKTQGLISVNLARPMNSEHIVNCPFIDPFQLVSSNSTKG